MPECEQGSPRISPCFMLLFRGRRRNSGVPVIPTDKQLEEAGVDRNRKKGETTDESSHALRVLSNYKCLLMSERHGNLLGFEVPTLVYLTMNCQVVTSSETIKVHRYSIVSSSSII